MTERGVIIDIINVIDKLETLIDTSKTARAGGHILVDQAKAMELVDQLRLAVPKEIRAAEEVLAQKDHIMNLAQTDARRTKAQAEDDYRVRLNKHELLLQAEQRAATVLRDAEERARRMVEQAEAHASSSRSEADAYALRSLRTLEQELSNITSVVRRGIDVLSGPATATLSSQYFDEREPAL